MVLIFNIAVNSIYLILELSTEQQKTLIAIRRRKAELLLEIQVGI